MPDPARISRAYRQSLNWLSSMIFRTPVEVTGVDARGVTVTHTDIVNRIEAEDGSGCCFNVTLSSGLTLFVRIN